MARNFWKIPDVKNKKTPYSILLEQATALTTDTDGLLVGEVHRRTAGQMFYNDLKIVVPQLGPFIFDVLSVVHDINLFPVRMFPSWGNEGGYTLNTESDLERELESLLGSPEIEKVIEGLLAQVRG